MILGLVPLAIAAIGASYAALVLRGWRRRDNRMFGLLALGAAPGNEHAGAESDALGSLRTLREVERRHIARVLAYTDWNKRRSCAILDISRPTLDRKIEEYGLRREDPAG